MMENNIILKEKKGFYEEIIYDYSKLEYKGEFKDDVFHGKGIYKEDKFEYEIVHYEGEFIDGKFHGHGKWRKEVPDSNLVKTYEGEFEYGYQNGNGVDGEYRK